MRIMNDEDLWPVDYSIVLELFGEDKMSDIDAKIKQCERDIAALQANLNNLKEQKIAASEIKFGDIIFLASAPTWIRVALYDGVGNLVPFDCLNNRVASSTKDYRKTGRSIFDSTNPLGLTT